MNKIFLLFSILLFLLLGCEAPLRKGEKIVVPQYDQYDSVFRDYVKHELIDDSDNQRLMSVQAGFFKEEREYEKALDAVTKLIKEEKKTKYFALRSELYFVQKKYDLAIQDALFCEEKKYFSLSMYKILAECYARKGEITKSNHYINIIRRLDKDAPELSFIHGLSYLNTGDTLDALEKFKETLKRDSLNQEVYVLLSSIYLSSKKDSLALKYVKEGLAIDLNNQELTINYFQLVSNDMSEYQDSIVSEMKDHFPNSKGVHYWIGKRYVSSGELNSGAYHLSKAIGYKLDENIEYQVGKLYLDLYKNDRAEKYLIRALKKDPDNPEIKRDLQRAEWRVKNMKGTTLLSSENENNSLETETLKKDTIK